MNEGNLDEETDDHLTGSKDGLQIPWTELLAVSLAREGGEAPYPRHYTCRPTGEIS
ncbi:MAG: hypothetical protein ACLQUY_09435 [Ktedonobacterales bacterium]